MSTAAVEEEQTENATADPPVTQHQTESTQERDNMKVNEMINIIQQKFETLLEMSFEQRPQIPKTKKTHQSTEALRLANEVIQNITAEMTRPLNLTEINQLIHAAASTIADTVGEKPRQERKWKRKKPVWKEKIEKEIKKLCGQLSLLFKIQFKGAKNEKNN